MFLIKKDILNYFKRANIKKNDTVFFHGNSMALFQIKGEDAVAKTNIFWNTLIQFLDKDGTIILPTFTYSLGRKKIYNHTRSKSNVGQFSEDFRKHFSETRSMDPIFSVCAYGSKKDEVSKVKYKNSFGKGSIFDFILKKNIKIICLGCELEVVTFLHYVEQVLKVPYRNFKNFKTYYIIQDKKLSQQSVKFYCRLDGSKFKYSLDSLKKEMLKKKKLTVTRFGRVKSYSFNAKDFFDIGYKILKKNNKEFINEV